MKIDFNMKSSVYDDNLYGTIYMPKTAIGLLLLIHDVGEHRLRYEEFANYVNTFHIGLVTFDLRGHHMSLLDNIKGHFGDQGGAKLLLKDILRITQHLQQQYPYLPLSLMGIGLGANLAQITFLKNQTIYRHLILINPYAPPRNFVIKKLWLKINGFINPKKGLNHSLAWLCQVKKFKKTDPYYYLSHFNNQIQDYLSDPFCGHIFTTKAMADIYTIIELSHLMRQKQQGMHRIFIIGNENNPFYAATYLEQLKDRLSKDNFHHIQLEIVNKCCHDLLLASRHDYELISIFNQLLSHLYYD